MDKSDSRLGGFAVRHAQAIAFVCASLCLAGIYAAWSMPSSVFPSTDFPRVVVLVDNGVMPADEMMAAITRPIEESMKDIPGARTVRSATGRGSAEVNVFFDWRADMIQAEQYVLGRLAQIKNLLPPTANATANRLTFASFPILGVSLTAETADITQLWETARYDIKPRFLRIPGVARVDLVGGGAPEYHVIVDPLRLYASGLTLAQVTDALNRNNLITPTGMHEENHLLFLAVVDNRATGAADLENLMVTGPGRLIPLKEFARVVRAPEPVFNRVTAEGADAVLLNIYSQPDGDTLDIARQLQDELQKLSAELPKNMKLALFYDQSLLVRGSVKSVWESIGFGLLLSMAIIFGFLKSWRTTLTAATVIPVTVLATLGAMQLAGLSFNLMTLGGITAAIGLIIDDAIVVVESIHAKLAAGANRLQAVPQAVAEIFRPLLGSTLTPVVVFAPLTLLDGIPGVFFRALALTMTVSLLTSLLLALTLTPSMAAWLMRDQAAGRQTGNGGPILNALIRLYELTIRHAMRRPAMLACGCLLIMAIGIGLYQHLESDFLPPMDEGGFVLDYRAPPGASLNETNRQLLQAETLLRNTPEVESYSRRTGAQLGLTITEPHIGDLLVKLKTDRERGAEEVITELRSRLNSAVPGLEWEFAGILADLIGDLAWSPKPVEIKLFSTDTEFLKRKAPEIEARIKQVDGVVDTFDGLAMTGPSLKFRIRPAEASRFGFTAADIGAALSTAMQGRKASYVLEADRIVNVRVQLEPASIGDIKQLKDLVLRAPDGAAVKLSQVAALTEDGSQMELRREDLRQNVAVTARLEGRDLGGAIADIQAILQQDKTMPPGVLEFGGLYRQQQASFHNLLRVLCMAVFLVFTVLLVEFRSFYAPIAIVSGALLAMSGAVLALALTGTSLNIVSLLGAIIGIGIVAKNGILMLDFVDRLTSQGMDPAEALVNSGRRRLRPVLMTSLAAAMGLFPLAFGFGSGSEMLKPLAIGVIGSLTMSVLLSLVATPVIFWRLQRHGAKKA